MKKIKLLFILPFIVLFLFGCSHVNENVTWLDSYVPAQKLQPITSKEFERTFVGNSIVGVTANTESLYEIYFNPNGDCIFRKGNNKLQTYTGKCWSNEDIIYSYWPSYKENVNKLKYYKIDEVTYAGYNENDACGPKGTYCHVFLLVKGRLPSL